MEIKQINPTISVAGQIAAGDIMALKAQGFATIVNNRPDGESRDQPLSAEIKLAAMSAGLAYHHIPLGRDGVSAELVAKTKSVLSTSAGPVFAFCRSGTRSTTLWALSQAGERPADAIITEAGHAGYDVSHLGAMLGPQ